MSYKENFLKFNNHWYSNNKINLAKYFPENQLITPSSIVQNMVDKANIDWTNPNLKICDPCCGSGSFLIYCLIKLLEAGHSEQHIIENMLYGSDIEPKCIEFIEKFWKFNKYNHNLKSSSILNKEWDFRNMKFDLIIMNPPYGDTLHLNILTEAIKHVSENGEIINLSPIRWLQDPLAQYKKRYYYESKNGKLIRSKVSSIEIIPSKDAEKLFKISISSDLGIYVLNKDGGFDCSTLREKNTIIDKIKSKNIISFKDKATPAGWRGSWTGIFGVINSHLGNKNIFETANYDQFCKKKETYSNQVLFFKTEQERKNCFNYINSKIMKYYATKIKMNQRNPWQLVPYIDFSVTRTDKDLYKYFNLTQDEINIIENEII